MFTFGETRPNCDANALQQDAQGTRQICRGRLNNETPEQRNKRLQIQREQRTLKKETSGNHRAKTTSLGSAKTAPSGGNRGGEEPQIGMSQAVKPRKACIRNFRR